MAENRIKWKPGEREQIAREVKRFNAKIEREAKKAGNIVPPKMETADVKKMIKSRADFNAFKKLVENAFKEGAFKQNEKGFTPYEQEEAKIRTDIINRARKRAMPEKGTGQQMGTEYYNSLKPKKLKSLSKLGNKAKDYLDSLRAETKGDYQETIQNQYIQNYLVAANKYIGYPYISQITEALKKIPADAFIAAAETQDELTIRYLYDNMEDQRLGYEVLRAIENLMGKLQIRHDEFQYDPADVNFDIYMNTGDFEPWED